MGAWVGFSRRAARIGGVIVCLMGAASCTERAMSSDGGGASGGNAGSAGMGATGGTTVSDHGGAGAGGAGGASAVGPPLDPQPVRIRGGIPDALYWDLLISGEGLASLEGHLVMVRVGNWSNDRFASGQARIVDGRFSLDFPQGTAATQYTHKTVVFDVDGDGRCGPGDAAWNDYSATASGPGFVERTFGPGETGGIAVIGGLTAPGSAPLAAASADDCKRIDVCNASPERAGEKRDFIDALVRGEGFDAYEGRFVRLAARSLGGATRLGAARAQIIGGRFTMLLPAGVQRQVAPELLWFVDADGDDKCGAGGGDLMAYTTPGAFDPPANEPAAISIAASAVTAVPGNVDVCAAIAPLPTMTVTGTGFAVDERSPIFVTSRMSSGATVGTLATHVSGSALPALTFERRPGQEVLWFADDTGDGICATASAHTGAASTPASDPAGNLTLPITDTHGATTPSGADVCAVMNGCL
jgi:hypothetical protein